MKLIPLTQGQFAQVDDEDFEYLNQWRWYALKTKYTFYATRMTNSKEKRKRIYLHRFIMNIEDKNIFIDHENHNGLDCQKYNLRECDRDKNNINKIPFGISKLKGVYIDKSTGGWFSEIHFNKKRYYLGTFRCPTVAAFAYNKKAIELHGNFAYLNFK